MSNMKKSQQLSVISEIQRHGDIARAARKVGVGRRTVYYWMEKDESFKKAMDLAMETGRG